jgi:hypothetical protein
MYIHCIANAQRLASRPARQRLPPLGIELPLQEGDEGLHLLRHQARRGVDGVDFLLGQVLSTSTTRPACSESWAT